MKPLKSILLSAFALLLPFAAAAFEPRNVLCIAPADPGGGWDFTCRSIASALSDIGVVKGRIRTQNMTGASGAVAFAHVVGQQKGNANLLVAASTATTTRLAAGMFKGFSADDVRWVAAMGADYGVIGVSPTGRFKTLAELVNALKADPASVSFVGGSAVGGWDHLKVLMLADAAGVKDLSKIRYTNLGSGGPAMIEILGGRADVFAGDVSETLSQVEAGKLKVLAILGDERFTEGPLAGVPTAGELGYKVFGANWRGFYLAPGITDEQYNFWVEAFRKLEQSDEFKKLRVQNGLARFWRGGKEMEEFVREQIAYIERLSAQVKKQ